MYRFIFLNEGNYILTRNDSIRSRNLKVDLTFLTAWNKEKSLAEIST